MEKILNYINGELVAPTSENYLDNYNPSNGQVYSLIPDSEKKDIDNAVAAAKEAFKTWSITPKQKRSDILMKLADTIEKYSDELITAESKDNGKPESLAAHVDIPRAPANILKMFWLLRVKNLLWYYRNKWNDATRIIWLFYINTNG